MFGFFRRRLKAAGTLADLCAAAEAEARREGASEPGAEHLVLAALGLPDGGAARAFERLGVTADHLREAIARQYQEPLEALGLDVALTPEPLVDVGKPRLYRAAPSGQALIQALAEDRSAQLTSARVLAVAADQPHGVLGRALKLMEIEPARLKEAALAA